MQIDPIDGIVARFQQFDTVVPMPHRFAPLVPVTLALLLSACAHQGASDSPFAAADSVAESVRLAELQLDQTQAEEQAMAELSDEQDYQMPSLADSMIEQGRALLGTRYRMGGSSAKTGFDCSGFVGFLYKQEMGIQLPRSSRELIKVDAPKVARAELEPGDVLFFNNRGRGQVSHVGIFIGDDQFIHSSSSRSGGVRIDSLEDRYWKASYMLAKRILPEGPQPFAEQSLSSEN